MAEWSKALPLTARFLSPLRACPDGCVVLVADTDCSQSLTTAPFGILFMACEKVPNDLGLGCGFCQVIQFSPPITTD